MDPSRQWEPEPLHLPTSDSAERGPRRRERDDAEPDESGPSGSHVIVIDL